MRTARTAKRAADGSAASRSAPIVAPCENPVGEAAASVARATLEGSGIGRTDAHGAESAGSDRLTHRGFRRKGLLFGQPGG